ncbi:MAG: hypothetical protein EXR67_02300 [Dehalococcoidia bacterium]|nr:hypothetical protein [Dehalococcoidia bacterium]
MAQRGKAVAAKNTARTETRAGTRRLSRRAQTEQRNIRRFLVIAIIGLVAILTIPAVGYYITIIGPTREMVVKVNDTKYTLGYLLKILRSYQYTSSGSLDLSRVPFDVVHLIEENELARQFAPTLNITVTDAEVAADIRKTLMGKPKPGDTTAQDQLDREFKERYRNMLTASKLSEAEHRELVRSSLLRDRVTERVSTDIATVGPQYHMYAITFDSEARAKEAKAEFERGLAFKDLVAKYSTETEAVRKEGAVGWFARGLSSSLDDLADKLAVNQLSDITQNNTPAAPGQPGKVQYSMFMIREKADARELTDDQKSQFKQQAFQKWLNEQRTKSVVETKFGSDQYTWVVQQLQKSAPRRPQAPQG